MTLLELIKEFSARRGLPVPTLVMGSQDDQLLQLVGLLNEVLEDLTTRYVGTALQKQASWTLLNSESQGKIRTLCPYGFKWLINNTFWDRSQQQLVRGPVSPPDWQASKASNTVGVWLQYRLMGEELLMQGALASGHLMALEYASDWAVKASDGITYKPRFTADTDTCVFPSTVLLAGLNWKFRLEKGLKYAEAFRSYEVALTEFNGHDGSKAVLSMDGGCGNARPGIMIPTGNWRVG
jgi:hypothetical protein